MSCKIIGLSEVPSYLHNGLLYRTAKAETISVPIACLRTNPYVDTVGDLDHLLATLTFWKVDHLPDQTIDFIIAECGVDLLGVLADHKIAFPSICEIVLFLRCGDVDKALQCMVQQDYGFFLQYVCNKGVYLSGGLTEVAVNHGHLNCLKYLLNQGCIPTAGTWAAAEAAKDKCFVELLSTTMMREDALENALMAMGALQITDKPR